MTEQPQRPSLVQACDTHEHPHSHSFFHRFRRNPFQLHAHATDPSHNHGKAEHPITDEKRVSDGESDPSNLSAVKRDTSSSAREFVSEGISHSTEALVTRVVQTVSLVQYVDSLGSPFQTQTLYAPPNTIVVDPSSGKTVDITNGTRSSEALPGSSPTGSGLASSSAAPTAPTSLTFGLNLNSTSSVTTTSARLSAGEIRNTTSSSYRGNSSYIAPSNTSSVYKSLFSGAVSSSLSTSGTASNWSYTTRTAKSGSRSTTAHSTYSTTSPIGGHNAPTGLSELPTPSPSAGSGSAGGNGGSSGGNDSSGPNLSPQQKQVIGGVLGSVAGVAILGLLLMLFLRYKKRKGSQDLLSGQTAAISRSLGNNAPDRGPGNSDMAERSAPSVAIASALATLTGRKSLSSSQPAPGGERGFYRVSGRKLPSILMNGGDGYTDPRESAASGTSDYFRGSQAFEPTSWGSGQLALGAPMRPVSGVPVMRSGPARTPVTENNPFDDPDSPTTPTNASSRTMAPRDSPTAGGSRFQEGI